jgi:hypothetical protein
MSIRKREWSDIVDNMHYLQIYRVEKVHGSRIVCHRVRKRKGVLYCHHSERITLERTSVAVMPVAVGDFCYRDNGGTWSHLSVRHEKGKE